MIDLFGRRSRFAPSAPLRIDPSAFWITVITPTTGKGSLEDLIVSIDAQTVGPRLLHILLFDDFRSEGAASPESYDGPTRRSLVFPWGLGRNGDAPGSALRSVALMAAPTPWVVFADDDVRWEPDHAQALLECAGTGNWASTLRHVWAPGGDYIGVDRFESVGDDPGRQVPEEMLDNNCMMFRREFGVAAAHLYRETREYNDDRLMYHFLKTHAGPRATTGRPTIHQICPDKLEGFFRHYCAPA
jgi:hypothetical protein